MKFLAVHFLFLMILCPVATQAQQSATTADGKKVILNTDGTWKYEASSGVTLKIETGLVYANGDVRPVARRPFALLDLDPRDELMTLPREAKYGFDGIGQLAQRCWRDEYPAAAEIIRKHTKYSFTTGFDGKGELREIKPGRYWLFGQAVGGNTCIIWMLEIDLTKDQSLTLDQNNAIN